MLSTNHQDEKSYPFISWLRRRGHHLKTINCVVGDKVKGHKSYEKDQFDLERGKITFR